MTSELQRKVEYAKNIERHLSVLGRLTSRQVSPQQLLDVESTQRLRDQLRTLTPAPARRIIIPFSAMKTEHFKHFTEELATAAQQPVQIWNETAEACGLLTIGSILDFNFDFDFEDDPNGVIAIRTEDMLNRMLLDFSEDNGNRILELEWSGPQWSAVAYAGAV